MINYNDGKWHGWNGGECPVHPETVVDEIGLMGGVKKGRRAGRIDWFMTEENCPNPVIAFRVIKEHKEPREFWLIDGEVYRSLERAQWFCQDGEEIIHVREVL